MKSEIFYCDWRKFLTVTLSTLFSLESQVMGSQVPFLTGGTKQQPVSKQKMNPQNTIVV